MRTHEPTKSSSTSRAAHTPGQEIADHRAMSHGVPSRPLLGLPLARLIPQDIHSVMDYVDGATAAAGALLTDNPAARIASIALGSSVIGVSALTDYRLSALKLIPIEAHEAIDHLWGLGCIAAPFVFGYWKRAPVVAMTHVMVGIGTILTSLLTDYRSATRATSDA
jgi:hypothetical protein